ncbi:hypothetical protein K523DRAFT_159806 [Schizophyllum commune Tattone D]|nr:hypothetical protein K523DRAFT_159806 [Schizophyllum commune Tattone D]
MCRFPALNNSPLLRRPASSSMRNYHSNNNRPSLTPFPPSSPQSPPSTHITASARRSTMPHSSPTISCLLSLQPPIISEINPGRA